jgi:heme exporter protein CcmD
VPDVLDVFLTPWWPDVASFLRMGRHGLYVWPTLAICALALAGEWVVLARGERRLRERAGEDLA